MSPSELLARFNCGPVKFAGSQNALYDRHLIFDQVKSAAATTARDRFEAVARSVRTLATVAVQSGLDDASWGGQHFCGF